MPRLIAVAVPTGSRFVTELTRAWDDGDAVLPVDTRLPLAAVTRLLDATHPAVLVDEAGEHEPLPNPIPTEIGDALVVATSGTTGDPKGVVLTQDAVRAAARSTSERLDVDPATDCWLAMLPVAHIGGLGVITRALLTDTPLTFDPHDPAATLVSAVPTQLERMGADLARFRVVLAGGSADWRERPGNVVHTYGMTETAGGIVYDGVPIGGAQVRSVDGELHVRGPMLFRAYRDGTDPKDGDGWFATRDAGEVDGSGRVTVHGRVDDLIVTGGEKVWPAPVEAAIAAMENVAEVGIGSRPDDHWGEVVVAHVVPRHDAASPTLDQVRRAVKAVLPAYAAPRELVLRDSLPRSELGKLQRRELRVRGV